MANADARAAMFLALGLAAAACSGSNATVNNGSTGNTGPTGGTGGTGTPPASVAEALARLAGHAILFDHASVGNGTMIAVEAILGSATGAHPTRFEFGQASIDAARIANGVWADHYFLADNGYPLQKMSEFRNADLGASGAGARLNGLGGVAVMKLCYADFEGAGLTSASAVDAAFAQYQAAMSALASSYPNVKFVHMTSALRDGGNELRERYNDLVRGAYAGSGLLFDIAEVESNGHRVAGVRAIYPEWNRDGGHLTPAGYDAVARALIVFLGGLYP